MACSVCCVTVRAVWVAWTHVVRVSMLLAVDVRAVASFLFKQSKRDSPGTSLLASPHTQWGHCWGLGYRGTQLVDDTEWFSRVVESLHTHHNLASKS